MLDYPGISFRWNWIKAVPSRIEKLENYQLDELLALADYCQNEADMTRANLLKANSWERVNAIQFQDEKEANEIREAVQKEKERRNPPVVSQNIAPGGLKKKPRKDLPAFEQLFVPNAMERALAAAIAEGLIEKGEKGYTWIYTGAKSHGVCAFWFAAKEAGLTKKNLKNNERITGAIRAFFQMDSLAKGTLDNANESASEFVNLKKKLKNKIPDLQ